MNETRHHADDADATPLSAIPVPEPGLGAGWMLMGLLIASLGMGLAALLVFYFVMWARADTWPPPGTPTLPWGLWLSTAVILASSVTIQWAVYAARRDRQRALRTATLSSLLLAFGFVGSQIWSWLLAYAAQMPPDLNMYAVTFYLLTGLHGLHVVGGLAPLLIVTTKAFRGRYGPQNHAGVDYVAAYWHFVDVVWLAMFVSLLVGQGW